eukprot:4789220-Amphidinium_carterae.2
MRSRSIHDPGCKPSLRPCPEVEVFHGIMSITEPRNKELTGAITPAAHQEAKVPSNMNCTQHAPPVRHRNNTLPMQLPLLFRELANRNNMSLAEVEMKVHQGAKKQEERLDVVQRQHAAGNARQVINKRDNNDVGHSVRDVPKPRLNSKQEQEAADGVPLKQTLRDAECCPRAPAPLESTPLGTQNREEEIVPLVRYATSLQNDSHPVSARRWECLA